ncbi:MAG: alpha/beta fold hydrolase [Bacteroidota bacterium]
MSITSAVLALLVWGVPAPAAHAQAADECVVVLHGLARSAGSMTPIARRLKAEGYHVANVDYPSRQAPIEALASTYVPQGVEACRDAGATRIHFVTHSLGGILVRHYLKGHTLPDLGRVVMLAPPNQGSEVVDDWKDVIGYAWLNGPAGQQLGTDDHAVPLQLGPVTYPVGVIAGTRTVNPILSQSLPNPDDGKVSVARTKVEGMTDHIAVPHSHTFIMRVSAVQDQVLHFIRHQVFRHDSDELP